MNRDEIVKEIREKGYGLVYPADGPTRLAVARALGVDQYRSVYVSSRKGMLFFTMDYLEKLAGPALQEEVDAHLAG